MARSKGRTGRPYLRARARVLRDQPICWLCGQAIDRLLPWPDPMSASVDHVVPLAMGGSPTDVANLRAAHLRCNSARGKRAPVERQVPTSRQW